LHTKEKAGETGEKSEEKPKKQSPNRRQKPARKNRSKKSKLKLLRNGNRGDIIIP
jgi:hypothetical protein